MALPLVETFTLFSAITATETKALPPPGVSHSEHAQVILLEVVGASTPNWTLDFQGRTHPDGTFTNVDYVQIWQAGAAALSNAQITTNDTTKRFYAIPIVAPFMQVVATRTGGSITILGSYSSVPWSQWLLTTARGGVFVEGPAAENAAAAGNPLLSGGRYDSSARTLGNADAGAIALSASARVIAVNPDDTNIGGTAHTDDAAFTPASDDGTMAFAFVDETSTDSVDEGDGGAVRMTANRVLKAVPALNDGTTEGVDHMQSNIEGTVLVSVARTASTKSVDFTNINASGVIVWLDITAVPGGDTITARFQGKDPVSGTYKDLIVDSARSATAFVGFSLYSGSDQAGVYEQQFGIGVPRTWRIRVVHSAGSSFSYSVGYSYVN